MLMSTSLIFQCVNEVATYVHDFIQSRIIPTIDGGVIKSDNCIPTSTRLALQNAIAAIRAQNSQGRDCQVQDIVDPYLFGFA